MTKSFTLQQYVDALEKSGWLAALPTAARQKLENDLTDRFENANAMSLQVSELFQDLVVTRFAKQKIDSDGPDEPNSYHAALTQLASHSFGHFNPEKLSDRLDEHKQTASISFELKGREHRLEVPYENDKFDSDVIERLVNPALKRAGVEHRFFSLPALDQSAQLAFVPELAFKNAKKAGLIPELHEVRQHA